MWHLGSLVQSSADTAPCSPNVPGGWLSTETVATMVAQPRPAAVREAEAAPGGPGRGNTGKHCPNLAPSQAFWVNTCILYLCRGFSGVGKEVETVPPCIAQAGLELLVTLLPQLFVCWD